jgi:trehalose 6-phosphate phosphatase
MNPVLTPPAAAPDESTKSPDFAAVSAEGCADRVKELVDVTTPANGEAAAVWEQICRSLATYHRLFLFLDFDGTLSELVEVPSAAAADRDALAALSRLSREKEVTVAVLSGRSVSDVAARVGLPIVYAGDHGFEIHAPDFEFVAPGAESIRLQIPAACNQIRQAIRHIPGAFVEAKRLCASVHFRQVAPEHVPALRDLVVKCVDSSRFDVRSGNCVLELRPRLNWNKGEAVRWFLERNGATAEQAICIGDDETDEDMFRRLPQAVNIRVLNSPNPATAAKYCVTRPEVAQFLHGILEVIHGLAASG